MTPDSHHKAPASGDPADAVAEVLRRINRAWLDGRPEEMTPLIHPEIVMALRGSSGRVAGREAFVAGFVDFLRDGVVHDYHESEYEVDRVGGLAVATYVYDMTYERAGSRYFAGGRDLWAFTLEGGRWLAAWRTMLDLEETPA